MSLFELEPLDPELAKLLEADAEGPLMPEHARTRLRRRLELASVFIIPASQPLGDLASSAATSGASTVTSTAASTVTSAAASTVASTLGRKVWMIAAGSFLLGTGAGVGMHATWSERAAPPVSTKPPIVVEAQSPLQTPDVNEDAATPFSPPAQAPSPVLEPPARKVPRVSPAPAHQGSQKDETLAEERSLVEMARTALFRGDTASALRVVQSHAQRFPRGRLGEERDSLWVQALVNAGKNAEARERARKFRTQYPQSLLLGVVERAILSIVVTDSPSAPETPGTLKPQAAEEPNHARPHE